MLKPRYSGRNSPREFWVVVIRPEALQLKALQLGSVMSPGSCPLRTFFFLIFFLRPEQNPHWCRDVLGMHVMLSVMQQQSMTAAPRGMLPLARRLAGCSRQAGGRQLRGKRSREVIVGEVQLPQRGRIEGWDGARQQVVVHCVHLHPHQLSSQLMGLTWHVRASGRQKHTEHMPGSAACM